MGQKVHPKIFRIGVIYGWNSKWFAGKKTYADLLREDVGIREFLMEELKEAGIDRVEIERSVNSVTIILSVAKPGFVIGRAGVGAEELKEKIKRKFFRGKKINVGLNIQEVAKPALAARVVMQTMINDLEKRMPFRRVLKQTVERVGKAGAQGVRVLVSGRLNGAEIARDEKLVAGKVPLHTLRADIDYAQGFARTVYGTIGVKVWIYRGEIFNSKVKAETVVEK